MQSKCSRRGCNFSEESAHMDEALDKLRQHYRAVHPTKAFETVNEAQFLESYNKTADEFMENYNIGSEEVPAYDWRHLRSQITRYLQDVPNDRYINAETLAELDRRLQEFDANQPVEAAPAAAPAADGAGPFVQWVEDAGLPHGMPRLDVDGFGPAAPAIDPGGRF